MTPERLADHERAIAWNMIVFFATIVISALLLLLFDPVQADLTARAANETSTNATEAGVSWANQIWTYLPLAVIALGLIQLVAAAAAERGGL